MTCFGRHLAVFDGVGVDEDADGADCSRSGDFETAKGATVLNDRDLAVEVDAWGGTLVGPGRARPSLSQARTPL